MVEAIKTWDGGVKNREASRVDFIGELVKYNNPRGVVNKKIEGIIQINYPFKQRKVLDFQLKSVDEGKIL